MTAIKLHLHVKTVYYNAIKSGEKVTENRLANAYWAKRLNGRSYDGVVVYDAYRPGSKHRVEFPWRGFDQRTIVHPHFGPGPVVVYAIRLAPIEAAL